MTISHLAGLRIKGQSSDTKPASLDTEIREFEERDTGRLWEWDGSAWIQRGHTPEGKNRKSLEPRTSLVQLFGDTFARTAASAIYLLEDETEKGGGTSLTNNGTVTFAADSDLPLRGYNVPTLDGSAKYFTLATEAAVEVGTGSFAASIKFKTSDTGNRYMFNYGDISASEQHWGIKIQSNIIRAEIDDGTTEVVSDSTELDRFSDSKWHTATMLVDRTNNLMYLFVDGELQASSDISTVTGTLDNVGETFLIGARHQPGVAQVWNGQLSNFQLYKMNTTATATGTLTCVSAIVGDTVTVNGLVYTAVAGARPDNTKFSIDTSDTATATDLAAAITADTRTPVTIPSLDSTATSSVGVVTIVPAAAGPGYNKVDISTTGGTITASGALLTGGADYTDHELTRLLNAGIRESATNATTVTNFLTTNTSARMNNLFYDSISSDLDYFTTVINTSEGYYDLIQLYVTATSYGISEIQIDGVVYSTTDQYAASTIYNVSKTTRGIFLTGGSHILKYRINGKNASSSNYNNRTQMIQLIKRDGEYNESDEATSGILFGDEIIQRKSPSGSDMDNLGIATGRVFNNALQGTAGNMNDLDSIEGDLFLKKGNYKITVTYLTANSLGKMDMFIGGTKVIDQLDTYTSGTVENVQTTRYAFLEGGKSTVKVQVNGKNASSTDYVLGISSIRFELINGKGNGDEVTIWGADDDSELVAGVATSITVNTSNRFNHFRNNGTDALNDKTLWRRYFSGGTYLVKTVHARSVDGGIIDWGLDSVANDLFDGINLQNGSTLWNQPFYAVKTISRGFHDITILSEADGGTTDFAQLFNFIQFTKIATVLDAQNDDNSDGVHGSLVPLGKHRARTTESTATVNLGGVNVSKFNQIIVKVAGKASASLALQGQVNITSASYYVNGTESTTTSANIDKNGATEWELLSATVLSGAFEFKTEFTLNLPADGISDQVITGHYYSSVASTGGDFGTIGVVNAVTNSTVDSIIIKTSTSTWVADTIIEIYGVLK